MKQLQRILLLVAVGAALLTSTENVRAQGRGNFDPAQFQQRMLERMREQFEVKDDAEWKLIADRVTVIFEAQRAARGGFGGFRPATPPASGDAAKTDAAKTDAGNRGNRGGREPSPDTEALQKAIEAKAPADEIKAKLAKVREARKVAEGKLEKAQEDLKQVLSVRQEALAVMAGLLK